MTPKGNLVDLDDLPASQVFAAKAIFERLNDELHQVHRLDGDEALIIAIGVVMSLCQQILSIRYGKDAALKTIIEGAKEHSIGFEGGSILN